MEIHYGEAQQVFVGGEGEVMLSDREHFSQMAQNRKSVIYDVLNGYDENSVLEDEESDSDPRIEELRDVLMEIISNDGEICDIESKRQTLWNAEEDDLKKVVRQAISITLCSQHEQSWEEEFALIERLDDIKRALRKG